MKQTKQPVCAVKQSIYLDVYVATIYTEKIYRSILTLEKSWVKIATVIYCFGPRCLLSIAEMILTIFFC